MMQDYLHNVLETKSEKLEAIKSQFWFRKIVLEQIPSSKKLYNFSDKQKEFILLTNSRTI